MANVLSSSESQHSLITYNLHSFVMKLNCTYIEDFIAFKDMSEFAIYWVFETCWTLLHHVDEDMRSLY